MNEYLICDIGNTRAKLAVFDDNKLKEIYVSDTENILIPDQLKNRNYKYSIASLTTGKDKTVRKKLKKISPEIIYMSENIPFPIDIDHHSKSSLGQDRKAACAGASQMFPDNPLLVIDAGSAITFDLILPDKGMSGGNISPGLSMRFRALNNFSGKLPLLKPENVSNLLGKTTNESIISGVQNGIISETEWYIKHFTRLYPEIKIVLTGGDARFFDKKLKNSIFVVPNLVLIGLYRIIKNYAAKN